MVQEKVERENTLSKPVQDKSDTPKAVHSFLLDPRQQLTLEEHRQKHEKVTPDWRNNNVLKSIKARSQMQSQLQTVDNQASMVQQKELQSNTSIVETQVKDNNSYQVAGIWDDAVHQAQKFLNQVEKLGEDFWETAKGGKQKLSDYGNAIGLSLQYIPQAIAHQVDGILKEALAGLAISLIAAIGVVSLTTAIGGAIGSLGGGVGAVPGAAAGLRVGIFLLDKMGLMFVWGWIASGLTKVGVALGHFLATVWDANGNSSAIDKGARQLADGMAQFIVLILEGIVAFAIAQGQAKALEMLGNSWFGKQLGPARLEQWLKQQLKARDTGGGSAGEAITPDGQRMRISEPPQRQQPMRMQGGGGGNVVIGDYSRGLPTTYGKNAMTKFRKHVEQMRRTTGTEIGKVGSSEGQQQIKNLIDDIVQTGETRQIPWGIYSDAIWSRKGDAIVIRQSNGEFVTFLEAGKGGALKWDSP